MNIIDILLILAIAAAVFFAVRHAVRTRRSGGCGCGCAPRIRLAPWPEPGRPSAARPGPGSRR